MIPNGRTSLSLRSSRFLESERETRDNSDPDEHKGRRRARNVAAQRGKSSHGVNKVPPENKENEEEE